MTKELGAKVRSELYKRNMKQYELAEMIGITSVYLGEIINGKKTGPKAQDHIRHVKRILNI